MNKVIGYVRTSTNDQLISLEAQENKIRLYCELHELDLVEVVIEQASAKNIGGRPLLQDCLNRLGKDVSGLIVAKLDRLTRSTIDIGTLIEKYFQDYSLISVVEQVNTSTPAGKLMLNLLTAVSQWEREEIGARTSVALQQLKQDGAILGKACYGYTKKGNSRVVNEKEMLIVKEVKSLRNLGKSYRAISSLLNEAGYQTRKGTPWTMKVVRGIALREYAEAA